MTSSPSASKLPASSSSSGVPSSSSSSVSTKRLFQTNAYFETAQASGFLLPEPNESIILKVLIIGDPCVGKTSYVQLYINGTFHENYKGTIGVDFALKLVKPPSGGTIKLQLWDVAGQERYTSMTRVYYRDAQGCLLLFDLTNRNSFLNVAKWKRDFDSKCVLSDGCTVPCMLVANKSDKKTSRQVNEEEIERLCNELSFIGWTEVSVKENIMVDDTMRHLVKHILSKDRSQFDNGSNGENIVKLQNGDLHKNHSAKKYCMCG